MFGFFKKIFSKKKQETSVSDNSFIEKNYPLYRVSDVVQDNIGNYSAVVQVRGKGSFFKMKPEEILANDELTASFHQHDIRLLTYLGYCGINTPQYKILAQKILANEAIELAIYDNSNQKVSIKNIEDIPIQDQHIVENMAPLDAYQLGYAHGRKSIINEKSLLKASLEEAM